MMMLNEIIKIIDDKIHELCNRLFLQTKISVLTLIVFYSIILLSVSLSMFFLDKKGASSVDVEHIQMINFPIAEKGNVISNKSFISGDTLSIN